MKKWAFRYCASISPLKWSLGVKISSQNSPPPWFLMNGLPLVAHLATILKESGDGMARVTGVQGLLQPNTVRNTMQWTSTAATQFSEQFSEGCENNSLQWSIIMFPTVGAKEQCFKGCENNWSADPMGVFTTIVPRKIAKITQSSKKEGWAFTWSFVAFSLRIVAKLCNTYS